MSHLFSITISNICKVFLLQFNNNVGIETISYPGVCDKEIGSPSQLNWDSYFLSIKILGECVCVHMFTNMYVEEIDRHKRDWNTE